MFPLNCKFSSLRAFSYVWGEQCGHSELMQRLCFMHESEWEVYCLPNKEHGVYRKVTVTDSDSLGRGQHHSLTVFKHPPGNTVTGIVS